MNLSWFSNAPWVPTGYGNQTKLFTPRIKALGHNVTISAFYGIDSAPMEWNGMMVYPKAHHMYGMDVINAHAVHAKADCIISLVDVWVVQPDRVHIPWFPWFPIDCEPIPPVVLKSASKATKPIVISQFGLEQARNAGLDPFYVPHGVDTQAFRPETQADARQAIGLPVDAFIVGMVAANKGVPPRKAFYEQIAAFAALKKQHPDALLYLHTDNGAQGGEAIDLVEWCTVMGLQPGRDVVFCDQYEYLLGFNDDYMRHAYNSMDVLMNVSKGEGFGIPLIEAQACGTPVITGDWTSMSELCFGGWKIDKSEAVPEWQPHFSAFQWKVLADAVLSRLLAAYEVRGNQDYRDRARAGAKRYDADRITEKYWKPTLEAMQDIITKKQDAKPTRQLSILCVTNNEHPHVEKFIKAMRQLATNLEAELVLGLDGEKAQSASWRHLADVSLNLKADKLQETVSDQAVAACHGDWVLRLDDDEMASPALFIWLFNLTRKTSDKNNIKDTLYTFPRVYLYPDDKHYLVNDGMMPDLQTRLGKKELMYGVTYVHAGNPNGTGTVVPYAIEHHKLLVRDYKDRQKIAARYESIRPGAGSLPEYARYNLPEDFYNPLETEKYTNGNFSAL
jgi:glycosyltransferase involved in cell wall biosynthesis